MKRPNELFREAHKRAMSMPYQSSYKRGDVVMNKSYGVISLIVEVIYGNEWRGDRAIENSPVKYELKDIKNEKSQRDITKKPSRYVDCKIVDKFYERVNPEMARLLYGLG